MILKVYIAMVVSVMALDLLWLGVIMRSFYQSQLSHLVGGVHWIAAVLFYLLYAAGVLYFVVLPHIHDTSFIKVIVVGAILGVFAYGTYDLTNQATLKDWPWIVTVVDMVWGAVITSASAALGLAAARLFS